MPTRTVPTTTKTAAELMIELLADGSLTIAAAVREYGVSKSRLYEWMRSGELPYSEKSGRRLLPKLAIKRLLASEMVGADSAK